MYIPGYAFTKTQDEVCKKRLAIAKSLEGRKNNLKIQRVEHGYNNEIYHGEILNGEFTELELAVYCAGSMPFGGECAILPGNKFRCTVHTD